MSSENLNVNLIVRVLDQKIDSLIREHIDALRNCVNKESLVKKIDEIIETRRQKDILENLPKGFSIKGGPF